MIDLAVQRFCDRWGFSTNPDAAVERALRSTFPELQHANPPIDLVRLASQRRVLSIDTVSMSADGVISWVNGNYAIQVNKSQSQNRRRFTIAHEIGHTLFLDLETDKDQKRFRVVDENLRNLRSDSEEILCNYVAAEILMPSSAFRYYLHDYGSSAEGIMRLSRLFQVSLWATARRVLSFRDGFPFFAALWQFNAQSGCYQTSWIVRSRQIVADKKLELAKDAPAFKSFDGLSRFRKREWLSLGRTVDNYVVDGLLVSKEPRRILTCFLFGLSDDWLSHNKIVRTDDQLTLLA